MMPVPLPVARRAAWHRCMPPRIRGWLVVAGVVLLPAVLLLGSNALGPWLSAPGVALGNLAKLFALVGTAAFAVSLLLGARISWIARLLGGLDQLYRIHRWLGYSVLVSLLAHALLAAASLAIYSPTAGLLLFTPSAGWEVFLGVVALSGLIVVVLLPRLWQLKHERFLLLHRLVRGHVLLGKCAWAYSSRGKGPSYTIIRLPARPHYRWAARLRVPFDPRARPCPALPLPHRAGQSPGLGGNRARVGAG